MEILSKKITVAEQETDSHGKLTLSAMLQYVQDISGEHSAALGADRTDLMETGIFWAVLRHRAEISRMPAAGERVTLETWPLPTTRTAYPRAVRALDGNGNVLFSVMSLWVLMDWKSRQMVLPGKSHVGVPGIVRGCEAKNPGSLPPVQPELTALWTVAEEDLDCNRHVNNVIYVDRVLEKCPQKPEGSARVLTVCYLAETGLGQQIQLGYACPEDGVLIADGCRRRTDVPDRTERVFALRLEY